MISEDKVRLMTKCACYVKNEGRDDLTKANFFKRDYVRWNVIKTMVATTVGYILLVALVALADYEEVFDMLNQFRYKELLIKLIIGWVLILAFYSIIAVIIYKRRFEQARDGVTDYYKNLRELKKYYLVERDNSPRMLDGEGDLNNDEFIDY